MRVSHSDWTTAEAIKPAAERYRKHGYDVDVVECRSERAGSWFFLQCTPRAA